VIARTLPRARLLLALPLLLAGCQAPAPAIPRSPVGQPASAPPSTMPIEAPTATPAQTSVPLPDGHPARSAFVVGAESAPPCGIASDGVTVWIADFRRSRLVAIDAASDTVVARHIVNGGPCGLAFLDGALFSAERTSKFLFKRDAGSLDEVGEPVLGGGTIWDVEAGAGAVWFVDRGNGELVKIDPATNAAVARLELGGEISGLAVAANAVWVAVEGTDETVRVDPLTVSVVTRIATGDQPIWVAATDELAWVTHADGSAVLVDGATNQERVRLDLGGQPGEPAIVGDTVWIPNQEGGTLTEVGLTDGVIGRTLEIGPGVAQVVHAAGSLWVSGHTDGWVWRVDP